MSEPNRTPTPMLSPSLMTVGGRLGMHPVYIACFESVGGRHSVSKRIVLTSFLPRPGERIDLGDGVKMEVESVSHDVGGFGEGTDWMLPTVRGTVVPTGVSGLQE